ncbi:MAG: OmpA family protein, partial [candidate division WOR-3 bacterium]
LNVGWVKVESFKEKYSNRIDSIYIISPGEYLLRIEMSKFGLGIIHGLVFDAATKKTIGGTLHYQGQAIGAVKIDSLSGSYTVKNLPSGDYLVKVSGDDTMYIEQSCTLRVLSNKITEHDFYLVKRRGKIILKGINFETGKAELRPEFYSILDEAGRILLQYPDITIEIAGHTDAREIKTAEFHSNWELSLARANAVKNYLIQKFNIKKERLLTRGYADTQPIAPNTTEAGMAKNRRTEFRIIE